MKRFLPLVTGLVLSLPVASQNIPDSLFELRIRAEQINSTTPVYLVYQKNGERFIDSARQKKGVYVLTGIAQQPVLATLVADHQHEGIMEIIRKDSADHLQLYLHPGRFELQSFGKIADASFKGSEINEDNARLQEMLKNITVLRKALSDRLVAAHDPQLIAALREQLDSLTTAEKPVLQRLSWKTPKASLLSLPYSAMQAFLPSRKSSCPCLKNFLPQCAPVSRLKNSIGFC